ncbi:cytochrome d ubiquinol oxidase subunit II [Agrobacterium sp. SHOUNA12C]|jgi:cytochrome d ubiquinol oxidase subunit II|uniref:Cytochrome d ubiquinol oxidase, subunit II n=3 Tax=Rhizobium rhizogenes TaxID=359 RepID=B9JP28_RHIR8|nr:cytochrome d ubiquinol oxidase, subunit II [Rhizobium rhizogenes K84]KAA6487941.1 cytochrome d ubiquinol oxidase subunit II [Agrobacterium sp. ICMP 7243]KEA08346.1 ubiquinol oxidase subunit II [Rhizobium rhizogenes]MCJ9722310.1 cytochrome d ubiquinol oxidase subunit II [Agrobacterium sp. BETTINA12B]MCJ9759930.1 cytochrome d ubiquinol oxidase subunit II [Agrobacterium sp. SHOUNA12C]OCI96030.1 cytochrome d ubiquinol oxidase subunit II [Agrobacterium sp. 13-626]OCJ09708.1 cytochrome d ubiquin
MASIDLTIVWAAVIGFAVMAYVVMDGFDLGIGILFPTFEVGDERDQAMNSIAPVWDGNETWLVMGGGGLFAAFPLAYAIILPATYPLMIAMLLGLVFRGVAFEFRWRDPRHRPFWDVAFSIGSFVAALAQGITLGAILQGIHVENDAYAGGWLDWLSPFSLLTGIAVVVGYALLGATWLIWKTEGSSQSHARRVAFWVGAATLIALAAVSAATPFLAYDYWRRWFAMPGVLLTAQVPLLVLICSATFFWSLRREFERAPFLMALALFLLGFIGLGISIYPYIVPRAVTIWDAAAPRESQIFMLFGALVIIPVILVYTGWAYWVFRGKAGVHGYH